MRQLRPLAITQNEAKATSEWLQFNASPDTVSVISKAVLSQIT